MKKVITYAIGDIHGRADLLESVIEHSIKDAHSKSSTPRFVFLGDIGDRGPRSRKAFDIVGETLANHPNSFLIRGNHDEWFQRVINGCEQRVVAGWLSRGGFQTLESYLPGDPSGALDIIKTMYLDHLRMIEQAKGIVVEDGFAYTHAGVVPQKSLHSQDAHDLMWIREPFLDHVGDLGAIIIHGHTVVGDRPVVTENRISIDTGAYKSGRLTVAAIDHSTGDIRFFQTDGTAQRVIAVEPVLLDRGQGTVIDTNGRLTEPEDQRIAA